MSERRVHEAAGMGLPCSSGTTVLHGVITERSKNYPSDSAGTPSKECFTDNPPVQLDPHQQITGMSSGQMIQFAREIGLEVSLDNVGMFEDVLLKIGGKTGKKVGDKSSGQSLLFSRAGSAIIESVTTRDWRELWRWILLWCLSCWKKV